MKLIKTILVLKPLHINNDGTADSNTSTITITITPVNDTPVVSGEAENYYSMKFTGNDNSYLTIPTPATDFGANDSFTIGMWFNQQSTNREEVLIHASSNGGTGFKYSPKLELKNQIKQLSIIYPIMMSQRSWIWRYYYYRLLLLSSYFQVDAATSTIDVFVDGVKDTGLTATYNPSNSNTPSNPLWQIGGWNPRSIS